jgi:alanyl-tRNA synthetase
VGKYTFIGNGVGNGKKMTFAEAWQGFEKSFTTTTVPNKSIDRYPVVARWRNDVDYVAAGIFCF